MYHIDIEKNQNFNGSVESLRGIAAIMVALFHCIIILNRDESLFFQKIVTGSLLFWFNGAAAVSLFFVISGYVLGLSLDKMRESPFLKRYVIFIARRILRIYPMLAVSVILLSLYLCNLWKADDSVQKMTTFAIYYMRDFNLRDIAYNILGIEKNINLVTWTLQVELLIVLILPILHAWHRYNNRIINLILLISCILMSYAADRNLILKYLLPFYIGLSLPEYRKFFSDLYRYPRIHALFSGAAVIGLLACSHSMIVRDSFEFRLAISIFGGLTLSCVLFGRNYLHDFLEHKFVRIMGKISYSFYLLHWGVLVIISTEFIKLISLQYLVKNSLLFSLVMAIATIPPTLLMAWFDYRYIEYPCMVLGRKIGNIFWLPQSREETEYEYSMEKQRSS